MALNTITLTPNTIAGGCQFFLIFVFIYSIVQTTHVFIVLYLTLYEFVVQYINIKKHLDIVKRLVSQNYSKVFRGKKINQDIQNRPMKE